MNEASSQPHICDRVPLKSVVKTLTQPERCAEGGVSRPRKSTVVSTNWAGEGGVNPQGANPHPPPPPILYAREGR
jgi:hypothetical protein